MKILISFTILMIHVSHLQSSTLHEYTVPGNYNNIVQAINQGVNNNANVVNGDEIIITVLEGSISHGALLSNISKSVKITVVGAGADKTFIVPASLPRRLANLQATAADNIELTFRNLTFKNWGYTDGTLSGGVINITKNDINLKFENVVFENNSASRGGVLSTTGTNQTIVFQNCFFRDNTTIENANRPDGQIFKQGTGSLTIAESTFFMNKSNPVNPDGDDLGLIRGNVLDILTIEEQKLSVILEKNTIVKNSFSDNASEVFIQPAISVRSNDDSEISLTLKDNIIIENKRVGDNNDIDFYFTKPANVVFTSQGNIANRVMALQNEEDADFDADGFISDPDFSFTHPAIDFVMDGDDPKEFLDEFGVPYFVYNGNGQLPTVLVETITLSAFAASVEVGSTLQILASVLPEDADDKTVTWSVDDTNVATIDTDGLLTAIAEGKVKITATANDGSGVTGTLDVDVEAVPPVLVSSITLSAPSVSVQVGATLQISATVLPEDADDKTVTWSVDDTNVATIDTEGVLTAIAEGKVKITATANDGSGVTGTLDVDVEPIPPVLVSNITLSAPSDSLEIGNTIEITATVLPEDADNKIITWSVNDVSIATISENGVLTGVSKGEVIVTASSTDGSGISAQITIIVFLDDTSVSDFQDRSFSIYPNPSQGLFQIKTPKGAQVNYKVFNISGQKITSGRLFDEVTKIDLGNEPAGLYLIQIIAGDKANTYRVIIE